MHAKPYDKFGNEGNGLEAFVAVFYDVWDPIVVCPSSPVSVPRTSAQDIGTGCVFLQKHVAGCPSR